MNEKSHYARLIFWSDEDGKYLGQLPELTPYPCVSGHTVEEVNRELDLAEEALLAAIEGELPERGIRVLPTQTRRNWTANNRIAKLRQSLNMGQTEFAAMLGASLSTLQKWEAGTRTPSGVAARLLQVLEHSPDALLSK